MRRRAFSVFPKWISRLPSVTFSVRSRKHSSGRIPQSSRMIATSHSSAASAYWAIASADAPLKYRSSSAAASTRSRCFSPGSILTFGNARSTLPHSWARRNMRRNACNSPNRVFRIVEERRLRQGLQIHFVDFPQTTPPIKKGGWCTSIGTPDGDLCIQRAQRNDKPPRYT